MPIDTQYGSLGEIERVIDLARSFVAGLSYERFHNDRRTIYAVQCCLAAIAEAARSLPTDFDSQYPGLAWQDIKKAGGIYAAEEEISDDLVWRAITENVEEIARAVQLELVKLSPVSESKFLLGA